MELLEPGRVIQTVKGTPLKIVKHLAEGGQGHVYIIEHEGKERVLKWYIPGAIKDPDKFYVNLNENARRGAPNNSFLWPITATERTDGSFGYVMEFRKPGFHEFTEFLTNPKDVHFTTYKANVEACLRIVSAFQILHQHGYCYQDMNHGNFFINPKTGDVLICDNDNVAPNNKDAFILGTPRFMAPELVAPEILGRDAEGNVRKVQPSSYTDYWSLAVVLFMIICMGHPLEGERWLVPLLDAAKERVLYGSNATFIYDQNDTSNRPNPNVHIGVIDRYEPLPPYMKETFLRAFSRDAVRNPGRRLHEVDWLRVLVRFQAEIMRCGKCGGEVFMVDASDTPCDTCKTVQHVERRLRFRDYVVTASKGVRIYRCMLESCNAKDALTRVGTIVSNPSRPGLYFLNNTPMTLEGRTAKGTVKPIAPNSVVPLKPGIIVSAYSGKFAIE